MPALGIRNKDGATKTIDINAASPLAEITEGGMKMLKPLKALPSVAADDVVVQSQVFGVGQTLQSVTRTLGATNVNTTGKPIIAYMEGTSSAVNASMAIVVSGRQAAISYAPASALALAVSAVIPAGANYIYGASGFSSIAFGEHR